MHGEGRLQNKYERHGCLGTEGNMNISGVSGVQPNTAGIGAGAGGQLDPVSKNLQNQIQDLQKQMQELSANQEIPMETKMKKRQELQKQISELELQLRQHQIEVKKEQKQKSKKSGFDDFLGTKQEEKQEKSQGTGMSAGSMEALISADASMKQADVHGSTAKKMAGRAGVLEIEIKLDSGRGGSSNIELKEEELAKAKAVADRATASQMESLAQAGQTLREADEKEQKNRTDKSEDEERNADGTVREDQNALTAEEQEESSRGKKHTGENKDESRADSPKQSTFDTEMMGVAFSRGYQPVDIKL